MSNSTSSNSLVHLPGPKVSMDVFLGIAWGGTVLAALFLAARLYTRLSVHRTLYVDDYFVILSWLFLLVNSALWQVVARYMYEDLYIAAGWQAPTNTFAEHLTTQLRYDVVNVNFLTSGLWCIKFCFLFFFKRLGQMVKGQKIHWWIVLILTIATGITRYGIEPYKCMLGSVQYLTEQCISGYNVEFQRMVLFYGMAIDVATDIAIVTIPIHLLWNVHISKRQKAILIGLFSSTVLVMIFAIVRGAAVGAYSHDPDESWVYMWNNVQHTVSIMIACIISFRSLATRKKHEAGPAGQVHSPWSGLFSSLARSFSSWNLNKSLRETGGEPHSAEHSPPSVTERNPSTSSDEPKDSTTHHVITVTHEFSAVSQPRDDIENQRKESWNVTEKAVADV